MLVNYTTIQELTGIGYRRIKSIFSRNGIKPAIEKSREILFESQEILPVLFAAVDRRRRPKTAPVDEPEKGRAPANQNFERARYLSAKADFEEIKVAQKRGELVEARQIKKEWGRLATGISRKMISLPDRLAQLSETASDYPARRALFEQEIKTVLTILSSGEF